MSYINKIVSVSSNEKTFIKTFVEQLTLADSRITCDTDIDDEFAKASSTYNPTFIVKVGENCDVIFTRTFVADVGSKSYELSVEINKKLCYKTELSHNLDGAAIGAVTMRAWKFTIVTSKNENAIYIAFGDCNADMPTNAKLSIFGIFEKDFSALFSANNTNPFSNQFKDCELIDRLNYSISGENENNVEIIKSKVLLNNTNKFADYTDLYDCSTVPHSIVISIDGIKYFTVGTHTLMPI